MKKFEDRMVIYLRNTFPNKIGNFSEKDIRIYIKDGIKKAEKYKVQLDEDVRRYLEYIVIYGPDFDINLKTSWAGKILLLDDLDGTL